MSGHLSAPLVWMAHTMGRDQIIEEIVAEFSDMVLEVGMSQVDAVEFCVSLAQGIDAVWLNLTQPPRP